VIRKITGNPVFFTIIFKNIFANFILKNEGVVDGLPEFFQKRKNRYHCADDVDLIHLVVA
jgi:hypothetical protein